MIDLFSSIPVRLEGVTGSYIHAQVQMRARDLFTGLYHIGGTGQLALFFLKGKLVGVYRLTDGRWNCLPHPVWDETITGWASGDLRELGLPEDGLRVCRLMLEADFGDSRTLPALRADELVPYLSKWHRAGKAGLALIRQSDFSAVMLLPADSLEPTEGVLVSRFQLRTGPAVVTQVREWGDRPCLVTLCTHRDDSDAWKEYNLRVSFGALVQRALKRYEELAGRFLISDLGEQVNQETRSRGWAISLFGNSLSVRQYFQTADSAGRAYAALLAIMNGQMDSVVGGKMVESILSAATVPLQDEARTLLQDYVLSRVSSTRVAMNPSVPYAR